MGLMNALFGDPLKRMAHAKAQLSTEGRELSQRFRSLGKIEGKPKDEIVAVVGPPSSFTAVRGGHVAQWQRVGFRIDLVFDLDNRCKGFSHYWLARGRI